MSSPVDFSHSCCYEAFSYTLMQVEQEIGSEVDMGERVLWTGQPRQGLLFVWADLYTIPVGLLCFGFSVVWTVAAGAFGLFGLPFMLIGGYAAIGRLAVDIKQRKHTYYGVTDRRVLIVSGVFNKTVKSLDLRTLPSLSVSEQKSGTGTVDFQPRTGFERLSAGFWGAGYNEFDGISFQLIDQPRKVYELIHNARRSFRTTAT